MDSEIRVSERSKLDETSFIRPDSFKSSSLLRLSDIISQNILLHPFVALRRTCQVNRKCSPITCVQPFSLIPFMYHQQRKQGLFALYRGLTSELLVKGIALGTETTIANHLDWPTEVTKQKRILQDSLKVLALRGMSIALTTPFLCSSVIATVQSVIIFRERPSFIDCLKDGLSRLVHIGYNPSSRMLPIWLLVIPTVSFHIAHKTLLQATTRLVDWFKKNMCESAAKSKKSKRRKPRSSGLYDGDNRRRDLRSSANRSDAWLSSYDTTLEADDSTLTQTSTDPLELDSDQISTAIMAGFIADVLLLPAETVLNSIYIQGTRTIIDNCDGTTVVLPVLTNYDGFIDCLQSIVKFEGNMGLYKGLGSIILQYLLHYLTFKSLYLLLKEIKRRKSEDDSDLQLSF